MSFDNKVKDVFVVMRDNGSTMEFIPSKEGLYQYDFNWSVQWKHQLHLKKIQSETAMMIQLRESSITLQRKKLNKLIKQEDCV